MSLQFLGKGSSNIWVHSLKSLGKGSFCQRLLQIIIRLNTLVDVIRKVRTSGEYLPIDRNFVSILLLVYVWSLQFLGKGSSNLWVHSLKPLGKGSFCQRLLQIIIRLNTLVDVIRVPKVHTSGE